MFAIRAFVGANGGGKTLAMVHSMVIPAWERGRTVVANLALYPERLGFPDHLYEPLSSWKQIPGLENATLVLDEISSVLPSRQAMSVPPQLVRVLNQLRKGDVELAWTAPNWSRCDVLLREVTQAVTVCSGSFPDRWQREAGEKATVNRAKQRNPNGRPERHTKGWPPNRYFVWRTYDAMEFDEFSYSAIRQVKAKWVKHHWRPRHLSDYAYETLDAVDLMDHLDDIGLCVTCGGTRSRPRCTCGSADRAGGRKAAGRAPQALPVGPEEVLVDGRPPFGPVVPSDRRHR